MPSLAIIGSGIAGLGAAHFLRHAFDVTIFEADSHIGGHANTVSVREGDRTWPVDTGFMVFNRITYPHLVRLFTVLGVPLKATDMSFSVQYGPTGLEYCGSSLNQLFGQRQNLLRFAHYRLLFQVNRFNSEAVALLQDPSTETLTLGQFVQRRRYGQDFLNHYLLPMSSAVWSTVPEKMLQFPATTLLRFFHNHGFLGLRTQHPWWTVEGGSAAYVKILTAPFAERIHTRTPIQRVHRTPSGVEVSTSTATQRFDKVILACHPPTSLALLGNDATRQERAALSAFPYQANDATLHRDTAVMPKRRSLWASWNQRVDAVNGPSAAPPRGQPVETRSSTHYWMTRLQGVSPHQDYLVSINGGHLIDPRTIIQQIAYEHPLFDLNARKAQGELPALNRTAQGRTETYFAGAWQRYGFHEDGLGSAVTLAGLLLGRDPWTQP